MGGDCGGGGDGLSLSISRLGRIPGGRSGQHRWEWQRVSIRFSAASGVSERPQVRRDADEQLGDLR